MKAGGGKIMKHKRLLTKNTGLMLLVTAVLILGLLSIPALAGDVDDDGFLDQWDDPSAQLLDQSFPGLDPTISDLFVILRGPVDGTTGHLMTLPEPLQILEKDSQGIQWVKVDGTPWLKTHQIEEALATPSREPVMRDPDGNEINTGQKSVRVTENLGSSPVVGIAQFGTPNYYDDATIFTNAIIEDVETGCSEQPICEVCNYADPAECVGPPDPPRENANPYWYIIERYMRQVIAHEIGHCMALEVKNDRKIGHHTKTGSGWVMDQSMYFKEYKKDKKVVWYITDHWSSTCIAGNRLK